MWCLLLLAITLLSHGSKRLGRIFFSCLLAFTLVTRGSQRSVGVCMVASSFLEDRLYPRHQTRLLVPLVLCGNLLVGRGGAGAVFSWNTLLNWLGM